ncbi:hypothetical protein BpHYR1_006046 [Brachionus plicatilis]|uniref:Uncharacterized protein n=1 Tax=Brachionus plicatilis TaxID=10195 RepID=A0A3M7RC38_BRAPC|nr:hypothetical protein BpHYR1_006046 [Brachionus plicatilis]
MSVKYIDRHLKLRFLAQDIDELNEHITQKILNAAHKSVPFQSQKNFKSSLLKNIGQDEYLL